MIKKIEKLVESAIKERSKNAIELAKRFPDLAGLSFEKMLMKLPIELDFITANELYEALNYMPIKKEERSGHHLNY